MRANILKIFFIIAFVSLEAYALPKEGSLDSGSIMWFAVFALSLIGVFALYVSSGQVDAISEKYTSAQKHSHEVRLRHDMVMKVLNDRLKNSTIGIHRHRELIEELAVENPDLKMLQKEAKRIKRDEQMLDEAIRDLENFKAIQSGKLSMNMDKFSLSTLTDRIQKRVAPYYMVKNNHLDCRIDAAGEVYINGDMEIMERVINAVLIELGQDMFEGSAAMRVTLSNISQSVSFEIIASDRHPDMDLFGDMPNENGADDTQYSIRMLQNYIAKELVVLMGGELAVSYTEAETICTIVIPMKNELQPLV